jgi:hypothetical protein
MVCARIVPLILAATLGAGVLAAAQTPPRTDGWVVIPVNDYRSLRSKAFPPDQPAEPPLVDATVTRIDFDLSLTGESVAGTATLVVDVLKDGWVRVLIPNELLVRDARVDGRPVSLVDKPARHVLLSKRGRAILTMNVVLPVTTGASVESVIVPPGPAALVQASLQLPRDGIELSIANGFLAETSETTGRSRWTAHGRGSESLTFSWRRRVADHRAEEPLRLRGTITELVGLGEEATQLTASVRLEVAQGLARTVTLAIPQQLRVSQVSGPLVADWDVDASHGTVRVTLLEPASGTTTFTVSGELPAVREPLISIPLVRLPDAEREAGGVAVEVLGAGEISDQQAQALEPADALDLGEIVRGRESPSLVAFRFKPIAGLEPRSLNVRVSRYATQAVLMANIDEARYRALVAEDGKTLVMARYAVRNNHRGLLTVSLPSGATLWSASVAGRAIRPGRSQTNALLVPLLRDRAGDELPPFAVEIVYIMHGRPWIEKGATDMVLPALDLPVSRTALELHHSPRFRLTPTPGTFHEEPASQPFSEVLRERALGVEVQIAAKALSSRDEEKDRIDADAKQLLDQFRQEAGRIVPGVLPVDIPFPAFGPLVFLAAELTAETTPAVLHFEYQREKRR